MTQSICDRCMTNPAEYKCESCHQQFCGKCVRLEKKDGREHSGMIRRLNTYAR